MRLEFHDMVYVVFFTVFLHLNYSSHLFSLAVHSGKKISTTFYTLDVMLHSNHLAVTKPNTEALFFLIGFCFQFVCVV